MNKQEAFLNKLKQGRHFTASALFFFFLDDELVYISRKLTCERPFDSFTSVTLQGDLIELERRFIEQYEPRYNVQQDDFNPFDYYRQHISMKLSGIQTQALIKWKNELSSELLKEAMDRVIKVCPDNPFGFLKRIVTDWLEKGYRTLDDVIQNDTHQAPTRQTKQSKGAEKYENIERSIRENGHHNGIAAFNF